MPRKKPQNDKTTAEPFNISTKGCIFPRGCLSALGNPIDPENPGNGIQVLCSNENCTTKSLYVHRECMEEWEKELWNISLHMGNSATNRLGDAGAWFKKHQTTVIWSKNQGYHRIFKYCRCPCGGYLRRDLAQNLPAAEEGNTPRKPKKKEKANELPELRAPKYGRGVKPFLNLPGLSANKTGWNFDQLPKKATNKVENKATHFWEETEYKKPSQFLVGMGKQPGHGHDKSLESEEKPTVVDRSSDSSVLGSECSGAYGMTHGLDSTMLTNRETFFENLRCLLGSVGGRMKLSSKNFMSLLDRVGSPLSEEMFTLEASVAEWILLYGPSDIYYANEDDCLVLYDISQQNFGDGDRVGRSRNVGWQAITKRNSKMLKCTRSRHPIEETLAFLQEEQQKLEPRDYSSVHEVIARM